MRGLPCHKCGSTARNVIDTRPLTEHVRRRCECARCGYRYTTVEMTMDDWVQFQKWQDQYRRFMAVIAEQEDQL